MLKFLLDFRKRNKKNNSSKVLHTLLFKEKFIYLNLNIKNYLKTNTIYLSGPSYLIILVLSIIFLYLELYIISIYLLVSSIYLTFFTNIFPCTEETAISLKKEIDAADYDSVVTNTPFILIALCLSLLGVYFNYIIGVFYFFMIVSITIIRFLGFKLVQIVPSFILFIKKLKKDGIVLRYHWFSTLRNLRSVNHINIVTLIVSMFLGSCFGDLLSEFSTYWNYCLWLSLLSLHLVFVLAIDAYIMFFLNMIPEAPLATTCIKCFTTASGLMYCSFNAAENGMGPQTTPVNWLRPWLGQPKCWDKESVDLWHGLRANFPGMDQSKYVHKLGYHRLPDGSAVLVNEMHKQNAWATVRLQPASELCRLSLKDQELFRVTDIVAQYQKTQIPSLPPVKKG